MVETLGTEIIFQVHWFCQLNQQPRLQTFFEGR